MNWVDVVIIGGISLVGVAGLWSGFLKPASGIGGLALGAILAVQHHEALAFSFADHVEGETVRRLAAIAVIMLTTTIAVRLSASAVKRILSYLVLGWIDRVAGALAGATVAVIVFGTAAYLIDGADIRQVRQPFRDSTLVEPISRVSFIRASTPWCSKVQTSLPLTDGEACTDLSSLAGEVFGRRVPGKVQDLIGYDIETVAAVVKTGFTGTAQDIATAVEQNSLDQTERGPPPGEELGPDSTQPEPGPTE